jgi:DNA processing protein
VKDAERLAWLRLARTENVGPVTFASLIARFGSAEAALAEAPRLAARGGRPLTLPPEDEIRREMTALSRLGGRFLMSGEAAYPRGLKALEAPPPVIAVLGHAHLLEKDMVAIVGARNASALGRRLAAMLAQDLGAASLGIVSGLARGIDAAAHEASLASGTVAAVAGGVDIIYPPEHQALYEAIVAQGVIVSEMRLGEQPQARHFPRRNRLISGLTRGVVVVEAAERSGSLITANYALEQGREIFAVPGSPLDPRAKGCNRLLRDGATLTENAEDVLAVLRPIIGAGFAEPEGGSSPAAPPASSEGEADRIRARVEDALGPSPVAVDELIRQTGAPPSAVLTVLLELELAGRCARHPGNRVSWA